MTAESGKIDSSTRAGFDLLEITLKEFMSYEKERTISFDTPTLVITGPTGSGKTSILDGITFALYARSTRTDSQKAKIKDICRAGGHVKLRFTNGLNKVEVSRGVLKKGTKSFLELVVDGNRINGRIAELNKKIVQLVGSSYSAFTSASFIRQDEMKLLGSKTDIERLTALQNLFRLDVFTNVSGKLKEERKQDEYHGIVLKSAINDKETRANELPDLESQKKQVVRDIKNLTETLTSLKQAIDRCKQNRQQLEAAKNEHVEIKARIDADFQRRKKIIDDINEIKGEQEKREELTAVVRSLEKQVGGIETVAADKMALEKLQVEHVHLEDSQREKKRELQRVKNRFQQREREIKDECLGLKNRIKSLSTSLDHEEAFDLLRTEGKLVERIARIAKETTWLIDYPEIIESINAEKISAVKELGGVTETTKTINRDSFVLSELKDSIERNYRKKMALQQQLDGELAPINGELASIERGMKKHQFGPEQFQQLESLKRTHDELSKKNSLLREKRSHLSSIPDRGPLLASLKEGFKELFRSIREKQAKEEVLGVKAREYADEKAKLEELNEERLNHEKQLSVKNTACGNLEEKITGLKAEKKAITVLKDELDQLQQQIKVLDVLIEEVFHQKGIPFFAVNKLLPRIGKKASLILANLTDDRYCNVVLEKTKDSKRFGFDILVDTPDGYRDIATFSGGERTQINAAIRLAISEELSQLGSQSATGFRTLFIDEGDLGSLDTAKSQQLFVQRLFSLTGKFSKIILITHLSEVAEQFENKLQVVIDNKGQSEILERKKE